MIASTIIDPSSAAILARVRVGSSLWLR